MKILVLVGGKTSERAVSMITGESVAWSLLRLGHRPLLAEIGPDVASLIEILCPDLAFIASHGAHAEDGRLQGMLEILGIKYTHSGVLGSAIAMDKWATKTLASKVLGIRTPKAKKLGKQEILANPYLMRGKFVMKPNAEGSSINVYMFEDRHNFCEQNYPFSGDVIVEEFIPGVELHAAVIKDKFAGIVEIRTPEGQFYDYNAKYINDAARHVKPPKIPQKVQDQITADTLRLHECLDCKGVTRADFIYNPSTEQTFFLEFNTHPGLTPKSLVPEIAEFYLKMNFDGLVETIISDL